MPIKRRKIPDVEPAKPAKKLNQSQKTTERIQRRELISTMYLQGKTQLEISQELDCSLAVVSNDMKKVRQKWLESSLRNFDEMKAQELARLDELEAVAWEAWVRSTQPQTTKYTKTELIREITAKRIRKNTEQRMIPIKVIENSSERTSAGDPRFLEQIARCIELRLKVIGAFKADIKQSLVMINWGDLTRKPPADEPDEVERMIIDAEVKESEVLKGLPEPDDDDDYPGSEVDLSRYGIITGEDYEDVEGD